MHGRAAPDSVPRHSQCSTSTADVWEGGGERGVRRSAAALGAAGRPFFPTWFLGASSSPLPASSSLVPLHSPPSSRPLPLPILPRRTPPPPSPATVRSDRFMPTAGHLTGRCCEPKHCPLSRHQYTTTPNNPRPGDDVKLTRHGGSSDSNWVGASQVNP